MADQSLSNVPADRYQAVHAVYSPNDTLTRLMQIPCTHITADHNFAKDVPLNTSTKTFLRLFRPIEPPSDSKLPIVLYFHGSGFIYCSASNTTFHNFCSSLANMLPALVVSVDYRLAPENRLPLAYEDAIEAMAWVQKQALGDDGEEWFKEFADFAACYLMGCSSGGNIVYHVGLRMVSLALKPLTVKGLILNQPYFGGLARTQSELRLKNDKILPLAVSDLLWELSLPKGSGRDHEYCNPLVGGKFKENVGSLGRCFVSVRGGDPLMDSQKQFIKMLEGRDVKVVSWFEDAGYHGMELFEEPKAQALFVALREFIFSSKAK